MRIAVTNKPSFVLTLECEVIPLLMLLSQHHYDSKCRAASAWPSRGPQQGFLAAWNNICENFSENGQFQVNATWDQLDTVCKICEAARGMFGKSEQYDRVDQFVSFVHAALRQASAHTPVPYGVLYRCPVCRSLGYDASPTGKGCPQCDKKVKP